MRSNRKSGADAVHINVGAAGGHCIRTYRAGWEEGVVH